MVFITGDKHGKLGLSDFSIENFPEQVELTKKDYVIICGDFGGIWFFHNTEGYKINCEIVDFYNSRNFTTLFVDGNHENFEELNQYPIVDFCGGKVHKISDSVYHLMRGEIFQLYNKSFYCFGGATSVDRYLRREGIDWWKEEIASREEMEYGINNLEKYNNGVDYIISHCCSSDILRFVAHYYKTDAMTQYLNFLEKNISFSHWYFGHYHIDKEVDEKHTCLYKEVKRII